MANFMTFLRILIVIPIVASILNGQFGVAVVLTVLGAVTDLVDGRVARKQGGGKNFGKLLDPLADKVFVLSILTALVEVGRVGSVPVILLMLREFSVSFLRSLSASQGTVFGASQLGKIKTLTEFLAIVFILAGYGVGTLLLWLSILVAYVSFYEYLKVYLKSSAGLNYP
ncbi:CDP-alcohol phosphatidyltransferase family protein [Hydrogenivirga sp. 128-5-R1-1]|uniref:CDP-alcohol phosphatidyltransferase family protein n=1 Tax=Hydrogenivirga sp. 128-5-R1-1 TaxID=392423 RepID=UPI00015F37E0|nr:CDP-alcohol phosphatidyltransferase family protein [Hydrogenivirga sp. 128-5-R1-1]EDP76362.1 phosphotidylglycerophosphate synthase [Hydrogenivirga sp. 128-5-R1-1]